MMKLKKSKFLKSRGKDQQKEGFLLIGLLISVSAAQNAP
jgi:hypothetical protein